MPYRVLQYQVKAEPVPLGAIERSTPDKWHSELPDLPVRKPILSVSLLAASVFVPVIATPATPVYVSAQACEPIKVEHVQYQAKAEPVFIEVAAGETVTADKWDRGQSQPLFTVKRTTEFTAYVTDNSSLLAPERTSLDKWVVRLEQPRQDLKRQQHLYPSLFAERLHVAPTLSVPGLYVSAQACEPISILHFQYQGEAKPLFTPAAAPETITLDKWLGYWPQPYFKPKRLTQYGVNAAIAEQADDGLPPVYWMPPTNGLATRRQLAPVFTTVVSDYLSQVPSAEVIRLDKWGRNYPDLIFQLKRLRDYSQFSIDPTLRAERASIDKWGQPVSQPRFDVERRQRLYPSVFAEKLFVVPNLEIVTVDKWYSQRPEQVFTPKRLKDYSLFTVDPRLLTQPERAQIDKWGQPQSIPKWDLKRWQYQFPALAIDSRFHLIPTTEIIRLDKWNRQYPDLVFRAKPLPDYGQFGIDPTLRGERITPDKWFQDSVIPRLLARLPIQVQGGLLLVPTESITVDKWHTEAQLVRPEIRVIQTASELLALPVSYLPAAAAEPYHTRLRALMPPTPAVFAELPFTDWYQLVDIPIPRKPVAIRHYEGINVVLVIPGQVIEPASRTSGFPRSASMSPGATGSSVSPGPTGASAAGYRRNATIKKSH